MSSKSGGEYSSLSNEALVSLSQSGNEQARTVLTARFLNTRGANVSSSYLDYEDFVQEGMIGFLKAIETFDASKGVPFEAYAFKCMKNKITSATGNTNTVASTGVESELTNVVDSSGDPLDHILVGEHYNQVLEACETVLSDVEKTVVFFKAGGMSYTEIGQRLNMTEKSVDNALQRARRKLKGVCSD